MWSGSVPWWKWWSIKSLLLQILLPTVVIITRGCARYRLLIKLSLTDNGKSITGHNTTSGIFKDIITQRDRGTGYDYPIHALEWSAIGRSEWVCTPHIISHSTAERSLWVAQSVVNLSSFHSSKSDCKILIHLSLSFISVLLNGNTNNKYCILRY